MSLISPPPNQIAVTNAMGLNNPAWKAYFTDVFIGIDALQQSGTTANRPTKGLYPGRMYFDTSLGANGKPIWVNKNSSGWVDATGAAV